MARGSSPHSQGRRVFIIFLVYCILSLFYDAFVLSLALRDILRTPMAQYSLFVLKVPLNNNQLTNSQFHCGVFKPGHFADTRVSGFETVQPWF